MLQFIKRLSGREKRERLNELVALDALVSRLDGSNEPKEFSRTQQDISNYVPYLHDIGLTPVGGNELLLRSLNWYVKDKRDTYGIPHPDFFDSQWRIELADLCASFEDSVKLQPDSDLIRGIKGIVTTHDGPMVAIDALAVEESIKDKALISHFHISGNETVHYRPRKGFKSDYYTQLDKNGDFLNEIFWFHGEFSKPVKNVVLLPYMDEFIVAELREPGALRGPERRKYGNLICFTPEQYEAIDADTHDYIDINTKYVGKKSDLIRKGRIINPFWGAYNNDVVMALVEILDKKGFLKNGCMGVDVPHPEAIVEHEKAWLNNNLDVNKFGVGSTVKMYEWRHGLYRLSAHNENPRYDASTLGYGLNHSTILGVETPIKTIK